MKVTCGRRPTPGAMRTTTTSRPVPTRARSQAARSAAAPPDGPVEALLYGVVRFEGVRRTARNVILAFESANAADEYASHSGFDDYLVVPLAFLTPTALRP